MADLTLQVAKILSILCQPTRIQIIEALRREERYVADILYNFPPESAVSNNQTNASHHLAVMMAHGIVDCRKEGAKTFYWLKHRQPILALVDHAKGEGEYAEMFKVLSQQNRVKIVEGLRAGEMSAAAITSLLGADHSNVARHLYALKKAHIVDTRKEKGRNIYWLTNRDYVLLLVDLAKRIKALDMRAQTTLFN